MDQEVVEVVDRVGVWVDLAVQVVSVSTMQHLAAHVSLSCLNNGQSKTFVRF